MAASADSFNVHSAPFSKLFSASHDSLSRSLGVSRFLGISSWRPRLTHSMFTRLLSQSCSQLHTIPCPDLVFPDFSVFHHGGLG